MNFHLGHSIQLMVSLAARLKISAWTSQSNYPNMDRELCKYSLNSNKKNDKKIKRKLNISIVWNLYNIIIIVETFRKND